MEQINLLNKIKCSYLFIEAFPSVAAYWRIHFYFLVDPYSPLMLVLKLFSACWQTSISSFWPPLKWLWKATPGLHAEINFTFWRKGDVITIEHHFRYLYRLGIIFNQKKYDFSVYLSCLSHYEIVFLSPSSAIKGIYKWYQRI